MDNKDRILLESLYSKIIGENVETPTPIKEPETIQESIKETPKVINEGLLPKGIQTVRRWIEELGAQEAAHKCISKCIEKVAGLSADDLPDTATLANGFEAVSEIFEQGDLSDQDIQNAWKIAKDTAREMLEDEGFYESTKIPHGIQPINEAKKKVNPWAIEKSIEKKTGKKFGKKHKEEIIKGIKKSAKKAGKKITSDSVKKKVVKESYSDDETETVYLGNKEYFVAFNDETKAVEYIFNSYDDASSADYNGTIDKDALYSYIRDGGNGTKPERIKNPKLANFVKRIQKQIDIQTK